MELCGVKQRERTIELKLKNENGVRKEKKNEEIQLKDDCLISKYWHMIIYAVPQPEGGFSLDPLESVFLSLTLIRCQSLFYSISIAKSRLNNRNSIGPKPILVDSIQSVPVFHFPILPFNYLVTYRDLAQVNTIFATLVIRFFVDLDSLRLCSP